MDRKKPGTLSPVAQRYQRMCAYVTPEIMANRLKAMGVAKYFKRFFCRRSIKILLMSRDQMESPHTIFVCSMADLFHESVPFSFIDRVTDTIQKAAHHRYQILTKRAGRMAEYFRNNTCRPMFG
jgi:protein gp37